VKRRTYSGEEILAMVKRVAAVDLGVRPYQVEIDWPVNLPEVKVSVQEGRTVGAFIIFGDSRLMAIDRIEDGEVVLEDPFHDRGMYPMRLPIEEVLSLPPARSLFVKREFGRLKQELPPMWQERSRLNPRDVIAALEHGIPWMSPKKRRPR
jgi:hypothetical protein